MSTTEATINKWTCVSYHVLTCMPPFKCVYLSLLTLNHHSSRLATHKHYFKRKYRINYTLDRSGQNGNVSSVHRATNKMLSYFIAQSNC